MINQQEKSVVQANREKMNERPKPRIIHSFLQHPDGSLEDIRWRSKKENMESMKQVRASMEDI